MNIGYWSSLLYSLDRVGGGLAGNEHKLCSDAGVADRVSEASPHRRLGLAQGHQHLLRLGIRDPLEVQEFLRPVRQEDDPSIRYQCKFCWARTPSKPSMLLRLENLAPCLEASRA